MHPILLKIGPVVIGSYGACVLLGLLLGWWLLPRYAHRTGVDPALGRRMLILVFAAGWFGCRILGVVLELDEIVADPSRLLRFPQEAGVWYGAIIAGVAATILLARRHGLDPWAMLDMLAVPAALGGGIGRVGCLLSGCCHGKPTDLPWAVTYTDPIAHRLHPALPWEPLHPAVMYEFAAVLLIVVVLDRYGRTARAPGQVGLLWIAMYAAARIVVEFFRGDAVRGTLAGALSTSQGISLLALAGILVILFLRRRRAG